MTLLSDNGELRALFARETHQRLAQLGAELLQLEERGTDEALVASIFRNVHTLKGSAAVVGIEEIAQVGHGMENLLEQLRNGSRVATPEFVDILLTAVDGLGAMLPALIRGEGHPDQAEALRQALDRAMTSADPPGPQAAAPDPPGPQAAAPDPPGPQAAAPDPPVPQAAPRADVRAEDHGRPSTETMMVPVARLEGLMSLVGESAAAHLRVEGVLNQRFSLDTRTVTEFRDLSRLLNTLEEQTMRTRMVPISTITATLHRAVRDTARTLHKRVRWELTGGETEMDRVVLQHLTDPLLHLVRNSVDHGLEAPAERLASGKSEEGVIRLQAMQVGPEIVLVLSDDGRGIDVERVRAEAQRRGLNATALSDEDALPLIFLPGLSTARSVSELSGRGVGLDVVRSGVEAVRGRIEVRSELGRGSEFHVIVPITLAVLPCLLVGIGTCRYAIPLHSVVVVAAGASAPASHAEGRRMTWAGGDPIAVSDLAAVLGAQPSGAQPSGAQPGGQVVVLSGMARRHAFRVDSLLGQRDVAVKGLNGLLPRLKVVAGASIEPDGSILIVLDAPALIDRARTMGDAPPAAAVSGQATPEGKTRGEPRTVLVVDDALTVREIERMILERAGYEVRLAVDGMDALERLAEAPCDLVITDVEMPRMDGFALTAAIRAHPSLANLPVLILTTRSDEEDRQRGLEAGADGYIVKSAFDQDALVGAIERLVGPPHPADAAR